jgi:tRNA A-37 threonylcarbamoyl transferase component Bud32
MSALSPCPAAEVLRRFVLGQLPEPEITAVQQHLADCDRCLATVDDLQPEDAFVRALGLWAAGDSAEASVGELIERLRAAGPALMETTGAADRHDTPSAGQSMLGPPQAPDEIGRLGSYRVLRELGSGGMGTVYEAEDVQLQRRVALKVINPRLAASPAARQALLREARAIAALEHEHVVTVHQAGEVDGVVFLVMQLLRGETLAERLRREGRLPVAEVVRIGREVAAALAGAHAAGLVHRDIKPGNLWLEAPSGRVKVLDFGVVQALNDEPAQGRGVTGTPAYMAPEQARGEAVGSAADLYSLGCVLYHLATGRPPTAGKTPQVLDASTADEPLPPHRLNPAIPRRLSDLLLQLLARDPAQRPPTARAVSETLAGLAACWGPGSFLHRYRLVLVGLAGLLLVGLGVAAYLSRGAPEPARGELTHAEPAPPPGPQTAPVGETVGELRRFEGHTGIIWSVAFAPDGRRLASASGGVVKDGKWLLGDSGVRIWDTASGQELHRLPGNASRVWSVRFSPDGSQALAGTFASVALRWDLAAPPRLLDDFAGGGGTYQCHVLSADGRYAATGSKDHVVRLWDLASRAAVRTFTGHTEEVLSLAVSADGRRVAAGGGGHFAATGILDPGEDYSVRLWDVPSNALVRRFPGLGRFVWGLAFTPEGQVVAATVDGKLRLWSPDSDEPVRVFQRHDGPALAVIVLKGGRWALSGGSDGMVRLWDLYSGQERHRFRGHKGGVRALAQAPDGRWIVSGGEDATVRLWDLPEEFRGVE